MVILVYITAIRELAIARIKNGISKEDVSRSLGISTRTLHEWLSRAKNGIGLRPLVYGPKKCRVDTDLLRQYVAAHPDAYLYEIGKHFCVSGEAIRKKFKKLLISRKKKRLNIQSEVKKKEFNLKKN